MLFCSTYSPQEACVLYERLAHLEWTLAQCKGVQKDIYGKLNFAEKRLDAMLGDSGDQVPHLMQWGISGGARYTLQESVCLGERQAGLGILCCPC